MNDEARQSATKYLMVVFLLGLVIVNSNTLLYGQTLGIENVIMTIVLAITMMGATSFIWTGQTSISRQSDSDAKLKRGERVKRLIDLMDEDELYALRQRLADDYSDPPDDYVMLGDDGELHRASAQ